MPLIINEIGPTIGRPDRLKMNNYELHNHLKKVIINGNSTIPLANFAKIRR